MHRSMVSRRDEQLPNSLRWPNAGQAKPMHWRKPPPPPSIPPSPIPNPIKPAHALTPPSSPPSPTAALAPTTPPPPTSTNTKAPSPTTSAKPPSSNAASRTRAPTSAKLAVPSCPATSWPSPLALPCRAPALVPAGVPRRRRARRARRRVGARGGWRLRFGRLSWLLPWGLWRWPRCRWCCGMVDACVWSFLVVDYLK